MAMFVSIPKINETLLKYKVKLRDKFDKQSRRKLNYCVVN